MFFSAVAVAGGVVFLSLFSLLSSSPFLVVVVVSPEGQLRQPQHLLHAELRMRVRDPVEEAAAQRHLDDAVGGEVALK